MSSATGASAPAIRTTAGQASRRQTLIASIATLGGFLFGYDTGVVSGALLYISADLDLTPAQESFVVSSLLIGAAFGGTFGGRISDTWGRKRVLITAAVLFGVGTLGCALAGGVTIMMISRAILGLAVGSVSAVVPLYIGEIAPVARRGRLVNQNELMIVFGQLSASVVNAIIAATVDDPHVWRWMLGVALIPAIGLFVGALFIPDSPRWLAKQERFDEARTVLYKLRTPEEAHEEVSRIQETYEAHKGEESEVRPTKYLAVRWVRILVVIGIGLSLCQQLAGVNAVVYYAPTLLTQTGLSANASVTGNIAIGSAGMVAVLIGMALVGRWDRRPMLMTGQIGAALSHATIVVLFLLPSSTAVSYAILAMMVVFVFFQQCFISTVTWLMLAELFPMRVRGFAMGISVFFQWTANFVVSTVFPNLAAGAGPAIGFGMFAVLSVLGFVFTLKVLPETRTSTLEELERTFKTKYGR